MKNIKVFTLLSLVSFCLLLTSPVYAQYSSACSNTNKEQPSSRRRAIVNRESGLRFEIPANYSAILARDFHRQGQLSIVIRNPTDVEFLNCANRNRQVGAGHSVLDVAIMIEPLSHNIRSTRDILREAELSYKQGTRVFDSRIITIAGQEAVVYSLRSEVPPSFRSRLAVLIHPNRQSLIKIWAGNYGDSISSIDLDVMDTVISSLQIDF